MSWTPEHEERLGRMIEALKSAVDRKYRLGQAEHGGKLWEMPLEKLLENIFWESIDTAVYVLTAIEQLRGGCGCHVKH